VAGKARDQPISGAVEVSRMPSPALLTNARMAAADFN
jgi:hypothetical protein